MHLKKINTESNGYKAVRTIVSVVAGTGSGITVECMSIPWVYTLMRSKICKGVCLMGVIPLATIASLAGQGASEAIIDAYAECWNMLADAVDNIKRKKTEAEVDFTAKVTEKQDECIKTKETYKGIVIPDPDASIVVEKRFIDEVVGIDCPFTFESEGEAKHFVEELYRQIATYGSADIAWAFVKAGKKLPGRLYDIAIRFGWTDTKGFGIDHAGDRIYVATVFNYHDISDIYETFKED